MGSQSQPEALTLAETTTVVSDAPAGFDGAAESAAREDVVSDPASSLPGPDFFGVEVDDYAGVVQIPESDRDVQIYSCDSSDLLYSFDLFSAAESRIGEFGVSDLFVTSIYEYPDEETMKVSTEPRCGLEVLPVRETTDGRPSFGEAYRRADGTTGYFFSVVLEGHTILKGYFNEIEPGSIGDDRALELWHRVLDRYDL